MEILLKPFLINELYAWGKIPITVNTDLKKVYFKPIPGYSMLDWSLVIEKADEIHCIDCAVLYVIDALETTEKLHRYRRVHEDMELRSILRKKYYKHKTNGELESGI